MRFWERLARLLAGRTEPRASSGGQGGLGTGFRELRSRGSAATGQESVGSPIMPGQPPAGFDPRSLSPLALAYVGDAVYELYVRSRLVHEGVRRPAELHGQAVDYVRAGAQARVLSSLDEILTEDEKAVVRRARNARSGHLPKGASPAEYHHSTAFEALLGYLFLTGQEGRLREILDYSRSE